MVKKRKTKARPKAGSVVTTQTVVNDLSEKVKSLRDDLSRTFGVLASITPGDAPERLLHKLQSVAGRTRPFVRQSTAIAGMLSLLGRHIATLE